MNNNILRIIGVLSVFGILILIALLVLLVALLIVYYIGLWKLFEKAGKNGWKALIPFYNIWVLIEISGLNWWYFLLIIFCVTDGIFIDFFDDVGGLINLVVMFFCYYNISKKFHKDTGYAVLITLFPLIMIPILGFSKNCIWDKNVLVSPNGPINDKQNNNFSEQDSNISAKENSNDNKFCTNCGKKINSNSKYCSNCGNKIK